MLSVLRNTWAIMLGLFLLMIGNGLQGTLLGLRGAIEGFDTTTMSIVMSAYFAGFLLGSRITPGLIRKVGHVRVFAALASLVSAGFILYAAWPNPWAWAGLRLLVGLCFAGVYVVVESWINDSATNETRGQSLSLYIIVQMSGIITAQALLNVADPGGYGLFVMMSVVVSISFAPILLSASPAPVFQTTKSMTLRRLFQVSPLGMVGSFFLGGIFSALFGMSAVYAGEVGLSAYETSIFVAIIYVGGLMLQYPVGWLSDRMDRRILILGTCALGALVPVVLWPFLNNFVVICVVGFIVGGVSNPLYSLLIAYTNDFLELDDMAAASGGLVFTNGLGAIMGPIAIGTLMNAFGPNFFFLAVALLMALVAGYAAYRMTQRAAPRVEETSSYAPVFAQATPVAMEAAQEYAIEQAEAAEAEAHAEAGATTDR